MWFFVAILGLHYGKWALLSIGILVPQPGIQLVLCFGRWILNHWTTREVPTGYNLSPYEKLSICTLEWSSCIYTIYNIVQAQSVFKTTTKQFRCWDSHYNVENTRQHSILSCRKTEQSLSSSWGLTVFLAAPTCQNAKVVAAVSSVSVLLPKRRTCSLFPSWCLNCFYAGQLCHRVLVLCYCHHGCQKCYYDLPFTLQQWFLKHFSWVVTVLTDSFTDPFFRLLKLLLFLQYFSVKYTKLYNWSY